MSIARFIVVERESSVPSRASALSERPKEHETARPPPGADDDGDMYSASTVAAEAPADLLDLVRAAEESATVTTKAPSVRAPVAEDVVDVGDEAVDAPPSVAPMASAPPVDGRPAAAPTARPAAGVAARAETAPSGSGLPPAVAILGLLGLAAGVLAIVTHL